MKMIKLMLSAFMLIFALFGALGFVSFDIILPVVVVCIAFITYIDAKKLAREKRTNEARSLMNVVVFLAALVMFYLFTKYL